MGITATQRSGSVLRPSKKPVFSVSEQIMAILQEHCKDGEFM